MHIAVDRLYTSKWEGLQSKNCEISVIGATAGVSLNKKGHSSPNYSPYTPPQKKPAKKKPLQKQTKQKNPKHIWNLLSLHSKVSTLLTNSTSSTETCLHSKYKIA